LMLLQTFAHFDHMCQDLHQDLCAMQIAQISQ
jgi:hypothetical protein